MTRRHAVPALRRGDVVMLWAVVATVLVLTVLAVLMIVDLKLGGA